MQCAGGQDVEAEECGALCCGRVTSGVLASLLCVPWAPCLLCFVLLAPPGDGYIPFISSYRPTWSELFDTWTPPLTNAPSNRYGLFDEGILWPGAGLLDAPLALLHELGGWPRTVKRDQDGALSRKEAEQRVELRDDGLHDLLL